jgi:hypothetical protein
VFSWQQFVKQFVVAIGLRRDDPSVSRNQVIRVRYSTGEALSDLARVFGITPQRVYQIVHAKQAAPFN